MSTRASHVVSLLHVRSMAINVLVIATRLGEKEVGEKQVNSTRSIPTWASHYEMASLEGLGNSNFISQSHANILTSEPQWKAIKLLQTHHKRFKIWPPPLCQAFAIFPIIVDPRVRFGQTVILGEARVASRTVVWGHRSRLRLVWGGHPVCENRRVWYE